MHKVCTVCKQEKELTEFYKDPRGKYGVQSRCKACNKSYAKRDGYKSKGKQRDLLRRYGLDAETYDQMLTAQGYQCGLCLMDSPTLVVDHCHASGKVRRLLCSNCNTGLGLFKDDPDLMRRAAKYVEMFKGDIC